MPWTWTWTLTISRIDSFAHLGQHGDDPHQKSLAGFQNRLVYDNVHDHVDVDVHVHGMRRAI